MVLARIVCATLSAGGLASCAPGDQYAAPGAPEAAAAGQRLAISRLAGLEVLGVRGERLGQIRKVLLDVRPRGQHYVLLELDDGKGFPYPVNSLAMEGAVATLAVARPDLSELPGYRDGRWPEAAAPGRFVASGQIMQEDVVDRIGNPVGRVREVLVDPYTARTRYYTIEFRGGEVLPVAAHDVRLSPHGPPVLQASRSRRS